MKTSGDGDGCARDVVGHAADKEPHHVGDVSLVGEVADRSHGDHDVSIGIRHSGGHASLGDESGSERVDANTELSELLACDGGHRLDSCLAGRVGDLSGVAFRSDAAEVHDVSGDVALLHDSSCLSQTVEGADHVDEHDMFEVLGCRLQQPRVVGDAGAVDEDVEAAVTLRDLSERALHIFGIGDAHLVVVVDRFRERSWWLHVDPNDGCADVAQCVTDLDAKAAESSCDHCNLAVQAMVCKLIHVVKVPSLENRLI